VCGELDAAYADDLYRALADLEARLSTNGARSAVVLDLTECRFIDSAAMGVLIRTATAGTVIAVVGARRQVRQALDLAGIARQPGIEFRDD
jgi:anti-anti-sigma factor